MAAVLMLSVSAENIRRPSLSSRIVLSRCSQLICKITSSDFQPRLQIESAFFLMAESDGGRTRVVGANETVHTARCWVISSLFGLTLNRSN